MGQDLVDGDAASRGALPIPDAMQPRVQRRTGRECASDRARGLGMVSSTSSPSCVGRCGGQVCVCMATVTCTDAIGTETMAPVAASKTLPSLCSLRGTDELVDDVLRESPTDDQPPLPRAVTRPAERSARPLPLRQPRARRLDRRRYHGLREPARDEFGLDPEAARAARPERPGSVEGERPVAHPAELPAA